MKRVKYYDIMRVICFIFIIFYHMMVQLQISEIYTAEEVAPFFSNVNMHIATLAVATFFMLSGACLSYTTKEDFEVKKYYKKRFIRILIPFYIVMFFSFLVRVVHTHSISGVYPANIPKWRIIFTFLGMDEWVSMNGFSTYSLGIGEWFLGCIIILYLIFPILRFFMIKNKRLFFTIATCIYIIIIYNYNNYDIPMHMSLPIKGYEFVLGMLLGSCNNKVDKKWGMLSVPVVVFFFTSSTELNCNYALKITLLAVAFFVSFSCLEDILNKHNLKVINICSKYSYELFLVHHEVIYCLTPLAKPYLKGVSSVIILFLIQIVAMALYTIIIKFISDRVIYIFMRHKK